MAETEVSKGVSKMVAIEEKCGLDMTSYQDLPKPDCNGTNHHNQANDLDNSYVFVSGADGLTDDVDNKNVEAEGLSVLPESDPAGVKDQGAELHSQIENFDAVSGEFQPPNEAETRNIEQSNGDLSLVNVDNKDVEAEGLSALPESDAAGIKDHGAELNPQIEKIDAISWEFQPLNEAENTNFEQSNGDPPLVNVDSKDVEAEGSSVLPESDAAGVMDQGLELHSQIEKIDAVSGEFQPLNEAENRNIEPSNGDPPLVNVDDKEAEGLSVLPESDAAGIKDQRAELDPQIEKIDAVSGEFQPLNEAESMNIEQSNGDPPLINVDNKDVEAEDSSVLPESDAAGVKDQELELHSQIEKIDAVSVEFQPLNEVEDMNIEQSNRDLPLVNVDNKDVEPECSSFLPESDAAGVKDQGIELHSQIEKIDAVSGEFQPLNEAENRNIEPSNGDSPLVNVDNKDVEAEGLSVLPESDAAGIKDHGAELDPQIEKIDAVSGEFQPLNEAENTNIEQSNGDPPLLNVDNKDVEAEDSSVLPESDAAGVKDQELELHSQIEKIDAVSVEFQPLNEAENRNIEPSNGDPPLVNVDNKDVEAEGSSVLPESDTAEVKDQGEELDSQNEKFDAVSGEFQPGNEVENRNVEQSNGDPTSVNDSTSKHEGSHEDGEGVQVSVDDSLEEHTGKTESPAEAEVKQIQDPDGKIESLAEAEVEKAMDQNGKVEGVAEGEQDKFDDVIKPEFPPGPVGNPESQVVALGLVAESGKKGESNNIVLHVNSSLSESKDQSNLSVSEALEACQGSQDTVVDVVECELQDVTVDAEDEVKSVREKAEASENEVSPSTSLDLDLESHPVHSKDETFEEEAKTTLCSDVLENQQGDTAISNNVQGVVGQMDESKIVVSSTDSHLQTVCDLVLEGKNEAFCVSEVDNGVQYPEQSGEQPDRSGISQDTMPSETKTEASVQNQNYPASNAYASQSEIEISEKEPAFQGDDSHAETEVSSGNAKGADCPPVTVDVKLEPEVHIHSVSAISRGEKTDDVAVSCRTEVSDSFNANKEAANIVLDIEGTEDMRDQLDGAAGNSNENLFVQENDDTVNSQSNEISVASAGGSSANMSDGEEENIKIKTKPFNFLIRIPRFDDENLREQVRLAKLHVDEKTKLRDAIQVQIQEKRANSQIHGIDYEYAKSEARSARKLVRSKRMEIDSLQSVINKAKNALSIEDIDSQIYNMEHMLQHETLPLKEEKQLIREIKQLKQLREQLSSNMGSQDEIKQAIEQREEVEDRLKILRKELDVLKNSVLQAEATAAQAEKKYDDENKKVKELQAQFRAADDVRQAAYAQWQNLRKELSKKSKHFFKYKDDTAVASNYAFSRDTEALYRLCMNQVENFMELWNTNDEFRRDYVRFNTRSTVRRFGTLDGRPLGPDEEPPQLPGYADERVNRMASAPIKVNLASQIPSPELKQETSNENVTLDDKSMKKVTESKYQKVTKGPAITVQANGLDTLSSRDLIDEVYGEPIKSRDEIESLRKEEEKRREEDEAKLKEQRRLEALAKANEARERKKKQAEKLQMRAELKTQKEAEQREKEREKRLRKKERKKAAVTDGNDINNTCETGPSSESAAENSKDIEVKDMPSVAHKKPQKPWLFAKQGKAKSIPPPLRNRNKKKLQQWMWVGITSLIIVVLFWMGNIGVFSNVALKRRGPGH